MVASEAAEPDAPVADPASSRGVDLDSGETWSTHLRPRTGFEAIDFGFQFARANYRALLQLVAGGLGPLVLLTLPLVIWWDAGVSLLLWWSKPIWERPLLHYLSRALFGPAPGVRETLRGFPRYGTRGLLPSLTWLRLSPSRSFDLPVAMLEGASGATRRARIAVLRRGQQSTAAAALTIVGAHVEVLLQFGMLATIVFFAPEAIAEMLDGFFFGEPSETVRIQIVFVVHLVFVVAMALVAPFYVAAGFSLYVHRRSELEAWDLELVFRRIAARARRRSGLAATLVFALGLASAAGDARADASAEAPLSREAARTAIEEVMADEAFHRVETWSVPRFLHEWSLEDEEAPESDTPEWLQGLLDAIADFFVALGRNGAAIAQVLLVATLVGVLGWIALRAQGLEPLSGIQSAARARRRVSPGTLFGLEITEESLPDDVAGSARAAAAAGRARESLALLYRGALARLVVDRGLVLVRGMTEGECLAGATPLLATAPRDYFERLTQAWLRCAYAHRDPEPEALLALCTEWTGAFLEPPGEGAE